MGAAVAPKDHIKAPGVPGGTVNVTGEPAQNVLEAVTFNRWERKKRGRGAGW